jgi:hypothetical protein
VANNRAPRWSLASSALSLFIRFWNSLTALQAAAVISTLVLTIGAVVEYWSKLKLLAFLILKWIRRKSTPFDRCIFNKLLIHSVGPILVVLGIAGEVIFEGRAFVVEDTQEEQARKVVGSLQAQTGQADKQAKQAITDSSTALSQAKDALGKAEEAQESLGAAESEANGAKMASVDALTLARGARQEADSFERDIASAKKQAANIAKQLAPRTLSPADWNAIGEKLKPFAQSLSGRKVIVSSYSQDAEGIVFSIEIINCLDRAGIAFDPVVGRVIPSGLVDTGVKVTGPIKDKDFIVTVGDAIHDRADTNVNCEWNDKYKDVRIDVSNKPIAGLPKITTQ